MRWWACSACLPRMRMIPERAVRAGLRIVEGAEELRSVGGEPLRLRVGVNTGEALVRLGASAGLGERVMSGDAINTASRIPVGGTGDGRRRGSCDL